MQAFFGERFTSDETDRDRSIAAEIEEFVDRTPSLRGSVANAAFDRGGSPRAGQ